MRLTCPECGAQGALAAFLAEDDAKRLLAAVVDLAPALQRPALNYLGLFKPTKNALSLPRAARLIGELRQLVDAGSVCRDERGGVRRTATPAMWAEGIEQMLAQRASLTLPLANHNYLRAVVFGIADSAEAKAEQAVEKQRQSGSHRPAAKIGENSESKLANTLHWLRQQYDLEQLTEQEFNQRVTEAKQQHRAG